MVKWKGYPDPTPEPLWKILRDVKDHPEILAQIESCKEEYLADHPSERSMVERTKEVEVPEASRILPSRARAKTERFTFAIFGVNDPAPTAMEIASGLRSMRKATEQRNRALRQFRPDFTTVI